MKSSESLSSFNLGILWFGAAVSLAEILTGALIAPLGLTKGTAAIVLGHAIGLVLFYAAGQIGSDMKKPSIETTKVSFGQQGAPFFAVLNLIQLVGWTGVMIASGASALGAVTLSWFGFSSTAIFSIFIACLIGLWIMIGFGRMKWINLIAVTSLFIVSVMLGVIAFTPVGGESSAHATFTGGMPFGIALELSIVMPLSWLPLISDYTRHSKERKIGPVYSAFGYFLGSTFMYLIGLGAALYAGTNDIAAILLTAGLPVAALVIVLFSTVTTTFLDVYSAAISFNVIKPYNTKFVSCIICALGALLAIIVPTSYYEQFLYLIGSAFGPLFAILLTDYYLLVKRDVSSVSNVTKNFIIWLAGVLIYRTLIMLSPSFGVSIPTMALVMLLKLAFEKIKIPSLVKGDQYE